MKRAKPLFNYATLDSAARSLALAKLRAVYPGHIFKIVPGPNGRYQWRYCIAHFLPRTRTPIYVAKCRIADIGLASKLTSQAKVPASCQ